MLNRFRRNASALAQSDRIANHFEPPAPLRTPVLFLVFNRPDTTAQVFEAIRNARPPRLYIGADGPREGREGEAETVAEVRRIASAVDWPCDVKTLFRDRNLGCRDAPSGAIDWFFEHEEQGIILEDDCLPAQGFFWFCEEMLERYYADTRIWQISGTMFFPGAITDKKADYIYSRYGPIWGWATWRRAWKNYDVHLSEWPKMKQSDLLTRVYPHRAEASSKLRVGKLLYEKKLDAWDYQWAIIKSFNSALTVVPRCNMIVNIGFDGFATHTLNKPSDAPTKNHNLLAPYRGPSFFLRDVGHDDKYAKAKFRRMGIIPRVLVKLRDHLRVRGAL